MIPTDVFDHFLMKHFEFKESTSYSPHSQSSRITFDAAKDRRLNLSLGSSRKLSLRNEPNNAFVRD